MSRTCGAFLAMTLVLLSACGNAPTPAPLGSAASSVAPASADPAFAALKVAISALAPRPGVLNIERDQLSEILGLRAALGSNADEVLALQAASEDAAATQVDTSLSTAATNHPENGMAILADLPVTPVPPPENDVRELLPGLVGNVGLPGGGGTRHDGPTSATSTRTSDGLSGTTTMSNTIDGAINGSVATLQLGRSVHSVVTDSATGATVFDETVEYQVTGQLDVCPSIEGLVAASVANTYNANATTSAGPGGGVASHSTRSFNSTSAFQGQVDDQANLGSVTQDYQHDEMYHRSTSVSGGPDAIDDGAFGINATGINDGTPVSHAWSLNLGDWSGATGSPKLSGSATQQMLTSTAFSAALDFTTIDAAYLAAQLRWRKGVCVAVTSPTYGVETNPGGGGGADHTEEVAKGSSTEFQIGLKQRFGAAISASVSAELDSGKQSLTPSSIEAPPGTMTYTAPNEDGQDATARFTSTSKQGIGVLTLVFHTGAKAFQVSISGTVKTSTTVSYVTTLSLSKVVLTKQPDGSFLGSGAVTTKITIKGVCPNPFNETGTMALRATREATTDQTQPQRWFVTMDSTTKILTSGTCLGVSLGSLLQSGPNGFAGEFMKALGQVTFPADGGTEHVVKSTAVGPATEAVDATVIGEVVTPSAQ